jgi:hypothetical protein
LGEIVASTPDSIADEIACDGSANDDDDDGGGGDGGGATTDPGDKCAARNWP